MSVNSTVGISPANVTEHVKKYRGLRVGGASVIAVLLVFAALTWDSLLFVVEDVTFSGGSIGTVFATMYFALSLYAVGPDYVAGAFCYGQALKKLPPGLHFLPFGLIQLRKESRLVQGFQCPGEPEEVFKGDDKDPLPPGMTRPIRVVTRAPKPGMEGKEILDTQMTIVVSFIFQYVVHDIFDYVTNFGDAETVRMQLRDIGETTVAEDATKKTASEFIKGLKKLNVTLREQVEGRFRNSGIEIISARLISPDITHEVSKELANIPIARAKAKQAEIAAEGEKTRLTKVGEGTAAAEQALLAARAKGRKEMMTALGVDGDAILASEAVRELSSKTDTLVVGAEGGMRDVMSLVKGAQSAINSQSKGVTP